MQVVPRIPLGGLPAPAEARVAASPQALGLTFSGFGDPALIEYLIGALSTSGETVNLNTALGNTAVFRSVSLISYTIGMLPLHLIDVETKQKATEHSLFRLLHREPNDWQTAFDFRCLMQLRALVKGNAFALIIWSRGRVIRLVPLDPDRMTVRQNDDWTLAYDYVRADGRRQSFPASEILHLRGLSLDGINGVSLVRQARDAIGLALAADRAIGRLYRNGSFVDGVLSTPGKLGGEAFTRLRTSWSERFEGADNAGKTPILEEGLKYEPIGTNAKDAQSNETRARQVEEVGRIFGVPRPLLMVDETSWGSGIDALGQFFVRYGLNPWFEAWQQAIARSLLTGADKDRYAARFNAGALLRGSMKDQGEFFARALGAGGHQPWMTPNEVRDVLDQPAHEDGDSLTNPMTAPAGATQTTGA